MRDINPLLYDKLNKQNQTIYEKAKPNMQVLVARAKSSVRDASYFTIEKIRQKAGITDISVAARRLNNMGPPDKLYNIWIDNGLIRTGHREYPDKLKAGWQNDFDIENGKAVSIVFDGRWELNKYKTWGQRTSELPWLFWVDNSNNLKARIWNTGTIYELATGVLKIDSLRGWVPAQAGHLDDQGVIVAYTKSDGKIYYRNYCIQPDEVPTIWESEKEVIELGTGNQGVRLFRTNDFRVGIIGEKTAGNIMVITDRNWAGMSLEPINFSSNLKLKVELIGLEHIKNESHNESFVSDLETELNYCPLTEIDINVINYVRKKSSVIIGLDKRVVRVEEQPFKITADNGNYEYEIIGFEINNELGTIEILSETFGEEAPIELSYDETIGRIITYEDNYCLLFAASFAEILEGNPKELIHFENFDVDLIIEIALKKLVKDYTYSSESFDASLTLSVKLYSIDDAPI